MHIIKYQKYGLSYIHLLIFLNSIDEFLKVFHIDEVIYTKLFIIENNVIIELTKIITSVILHGLYGDINPNSLYISNAQDDFPKYIKHYSRNFLEKTSI